VEPIDRQPDDSFDDADVALDDLLRAARWPEPTAASTRRLEAAWARVSPARSCWHLAPRMLSAAAVLALGFGVAAVVALRPVHRDRETVATVTPSAPVPGPLPPTAVATEVPTVVTWHEPARAANVWERAAVAAAERRRRQAKAAAKDSVNLSPLFDAMSDPRVATRLAAARELGRLNRPEVTAQLVARVEGDVGRREALAALLCTPGTDAAAYVSAARESRALRGTVRAVELQLAHY
jgi:hypothetical protein